MDIKTLLHKIENETGYRARALLTTTTSEIYDYFTRYCPDYYTLERGQVALIPIYDTKNDYRVLGILKVRSEELVTHKKLILISKIANEHFMEK